MRRPSRDASQQWKHVDKPIIGRPLWGMSSGGVSRNSVGRSSTASTRYDSRSTSGTLSTFGTLSSAPKTPRRETIPQDLPEAVEGITKPASDKDAASLASDTDSFENSEGESEVWGGEAQVDSVMAKLHNLMNMAQVQLEKTGRRTSAVQEGRRASLEASRRASHSRRISHLPSPAGGLQPQQQTQYGSEQRLSIESNGTLMCDMLDMVTEDLALLTEDLGLLDPNGRISELEGQLEKEAVNACAAQEEVLQLRATLLEKEAENAMLKLEKEAALTVKERPAIIDPSVQMLREQMDLLRIRHSELARNQQRNALAFETACSRSVLESSFVFKTNSIKASWETVGLDKGSMLQAETTDTLPAQATEPVEATKAAEETEKEAVYLSRAPSTTGWSNAVPTGTTFAALAPTVANWVVPPKAVLPFCTSASSAGSLASKYRQSLRQNSSMRCASPLPSYVPSNRTSLASQVSRAQSSPHVVQASRSCSRASSPCRFVTSPLPSLLPVSANPRMDLRSVSPPYTRRAGYSSEASSFHQGAIGMPPTVVPPMGDTGLPLASPRSSSPGVVQVSINCSRSCSPCRSVTSPSPPLLPLSAKPSMDLLSVSRPDTSMAVYSSEATSFHQGDIGLTCSLTPREIKQDLPTGARSAQAPFPEHQEASFCRTIGRNSTTRPLRWKLKWILE